MQHLLPSIRQLHGVLCYAPPGLHAACSANQEGEAAYLGCRHQGIRCQGQVEVVAWYM